MTARVRGETGDDQFRLVLVRDGLDIVIVDERSVVIDAVLCRIVEPPRKVDLGAVRQVSTLGEAHAEQLVAWLQQIAMQTAGVGLRARVRLHVGIVSAEQLLRALDGERLRIVDVLAAAVVALARDNLRRTCSSTRSPAPP